MLKPRLNASHYSGVEFVRDLLKNASFVGQRAWVLDEAHALSTQAQTALLSAMEDRAGNDLFFFCTNSTNFYRLCVGGAARFSCSLSRPTKAPSYSRAVGVLRTAKSRYHKTSLPLFRLPTSVLPLLS
jgi:hypothetical protein